jgi:hypothetical protein
MTSAEPVYAHSLREVFDRAAWELLTDYHDRVASLAQGFAAAFGAGAWGRGLRHWPPCRR